MHGGSVGGGGAAERLGSPLSTQTGLNQQQPRLFGLLDETCPTPAPPLRLHLPDSAHGGLCSCSLIPQTRLSELSPVADRMRTGLAVVPKPEPAGSDPRGLGGEQVYVSWSC